MKRVHLSSLNRATLIFLALAIIILVSLVLTSLFQQTVSAPGSSPETGLEPTAAVARLELVEGQQMSSDSYNFSADLSAPPALSLPLKTLADFPATASARTATIDTTAGQLVVELYADQAPLTVANFVDLADQHFYDGLKFHRVETGFVVQTGDPASRGVSDEAQLAQLGTGYPGYRIADEFGPGLSHDQAGILSMANINVDGSYPDSGGSQFFITLAPLTYLDGRHAIFGRVIEGLEVLDKIRLGDEITAIRLD